MSKIGFFSPLAGVGTDCGYGYAAVELIKAWQRQGVPVWSYDREAPVAFNFGQPHFYERVEGALNIGYTPWESMGVPKSWHHFMSQMDEIWVPCQANKIWYQDAGIDKPIRVLPHGVNAEHYPLVERHEDDVLKFLHIGEPTIRKGGLQTYLAFKEVFKDRSDVHLTLKGKPRFPVRGDNVTVIRDRYTQEQMTQLYLDHHVLVYPTMGEGFGFIPFQGAATGMPTFVTDWSGPVDFMHYCYPIAVERLTEAHYEPHMGLWAVPSHLSLTRHLKNVADNPGRYLRQAYRTGALLQADWSWDKIGSCALEFMTESLNALPS